MTGNASMTGSEVLIYNAGSNYNGGSGNSFGGVTLSGNGTISLTAVSTGPYAGIVLFQSRDNTRAIALSGNAAAGLGGGIIYAPAALLTLSGNAQLGSSKLPTSPLVVNELQLTGNSVNDLAASGTDNTSGANAPGQLLAGDVTVYVDSSTNAFTPDELSRIQDAINIVDATTAPYGVTVSEVDPSQSVYATTTVTVSATSLAGSAADGVLGCESSDGITLVSGWNWYTGADPTAIQPGQYDFETIFIHELGHALGLGHSPDSSSVMYATLDPGITKRVLTAADLNIPDTDSGPCALHAAVEVGGNGQGAVTPPIQRLTPSISPPLTKETIAAALALGDAPSAEGDVLAPFTVGMGWVSQWAWLALGLKGGSDSSSTPSILTPDNRLAEQEAPPRRGVNLFLTGPGNAGKAASSASNVPARDAGTLSESSSALLLEDDAQAADDLLEAAPDDDLPDITVLDYFFQQFGSSEAEGMDNSSAEAP